MVEPARAIRSERLGVIALLVSGILWGVVWMPLKHFAAHGVSGLSMTLMSYGTVGLLAAPLIWRERAAWQPQTPLFLAAALIGGTANVCFITALMFGEVVRVMLLFYLAPVWGVLGARVFLKEPITPARIAGVAMAVVGALLILGGPNALAAPISIADLLGLASGFLYATQNIAFRAADRVPVLSKALSVFLGCGIVSAVLLPFIGHAVQLPSLSIGLQILAFGLWMIAAMWTTMYGVTHLEAGRSAVLLVFELVAAVASAMLVGGERLSWVEWIGAVLITAAALLEARSVTTVEGKAA